MPSLTPEQQARRDYVRLAYPGCFLHVTPQEVIVCEANGTVIAAGTTGIDAYWSAADVAALQGIDILAEKEPAGLLSKRQEANLLTVTVVLAGIGLIGFAGLIEVARYLMDLAHGNPWAFALIALLALVAAQAIARGPKDSAQEVQR